jgi:hypothetical protein
VAALAGPEEVEAVGLMTRAQRRSLIMRNPVSRVAETFRLPLAVRWSGTAAHGDSREERYAAVLEHVRDTLECLLPEHEDAAREILGLVPWPPGCPVPEYEAIFDAGPCPTCGGTGVAGFVSAWRCPTCRGAGIVG